MTDRSFEGINPVAGNTGALANEINRTGAQERERKRLASGAGSALSSVAQSMNGFQPSSEVGTVRLGSGGSLNFDALIKGMHQENDYG